MNLHRRIWSPLQLHALVTMLTISILIKASESLNFCLQSRAIVNEGTDLPSILQSMFFQSGFWKKWVEGKRFYGGYNTLVDTLTVIVDVKWRCKMQIQNAGAYHQLKQGNPVNLLWNLTSLNGVSLPVAIFKAGRSTQKLWKQRASCCAEIESKNLMFWGESALHFIVLRTPFHKIPPLLRNDYSSFGNKNVCNKDI